VQALTTKADKRVTVGLGISANAAGASAYYHT